MSKSVTWPWFHIMVVKPFTPAHLEAHASCPPCAVVHVCATGCVYQSVPGDSGATAGAVRGATPPARAAPGVAVTSAAPVSRLTTSPRGPTPAQPSVGRTTTSTTVWFLASHPPLWDSVFLSYLFVINKTERIPVRHPSRIQCSEQPACQ